MIFLDRISCIDFVVLRSYAHSASANRKILLLVMFINIRIHLRLVSLYSGKKGHRYLESLPILNNGLTEIAVPFLHDRTLIHLQRTFYPALWRGVLERLSRRRFSRW